MSYKGYKNKFTGENPLTGAIEALVDAELLNWLSFQVIIAASGSTVDIDVTIEESNKKEDASFLDTTQTKTLSVAGISNDIFFISQATSRFYRLRFDIAQGVIDSYEIHVIGKG